MTDSSRWAGPLVPGHPRRPGTLRPRAWRPPVLRAQEDFRPYGMDLRFSSVTVMNCNPTLERR